MSGGPGLVWVLDGSGCVGPWRASGLAARREYEVRWEVGPHEVVRADGLGEGIVTRGPGYVARWSDPERPEWWHRLPGPWVTASMARRACEGDAEAAALRRGCEGLVLR